MLTRYEANDMQELLNMNQEMKARMLNNLDLCEDLANDVKKLGIEQCLAIGELIDSYIELINVASDLASEYDKFYENGDTYERKIQRKP